MADTQVTDFTALPGVDTDAANDRIPIIDVSASGAAKNKTITPGELTKALRAFPFQELSLSHSNDWNLGPLMGRTAVDRGCAGFEFCRVFLPEISDVIADGNMSLAIRAARVGQTDRFRIYPHPDDIQGYWGRRIAVGSNLAMFAISPLDAGQSCVLTLVQVNQVQLHVDTETLANIVVGDTLTGDETTGEVIFIDEDAGIIQLANCSGTYASGEVVTNGGSGTATLIHNSVDCTWMWQAEMVSGAMADTDDGQYAAWY